MRRNANHPANRTELATRRQSGGSRQAQYRKQAEDLRKVFEYEQRQSLVATVFANTTAKKG